MALDPLIQNFLNQFRMPELFVQAPSDPLGNKGDWKQIVERLRAAIQHDPRLRPTLSQLEADVAAGRLAPSAAARRVLADFTAKDSP